MAGLIARQLVIDLDQVGFESATEVRIILRRATVADSFVIIPENFRINVVLGGGVGQAELLPSTYGSIYDCTLLDASKTKLAHFFFEMPDEDSDLSDLIKLTAWPASSGGTRPPVDTPSKLIDLTDVVEGDPDSGAGKYLTEIAPVGGERRFSFRSVLAENVSGLSELLNEKLDVDGYSLKKSIAGDESIPLADGIKEATTPDQLAAYTNQALGLPALFDGKLDVDGYPPRVTLTGTESIPLADGVKEATTPDQLASYIRFQQQEISVSLGTINNNQTATGSFEMPAGFTLRTIETSASMRVRLYQSADARDADLNRLLGVDYPQGSAMFLEFYSVIGLLEAVLSPAVDGYTDDGYVYYSVQNKSLADQAMSVTFTYLPTEV